MASAARKSVKKSGARRKTTAKTTVLPRVVQPHGGALNAGGTPGNRGGGRKRDEIRAKLERIVDERGVKYLDDVLAGRVEYIGTCPECGWESAGVEPGAIPSPDARLRAADVALKYSIGSEKTIRLEGYRDVAMAFDLIQARIHASLPEHAAAALLTEIARDLRGIP